MRAVWLKRHLVPAMIVMICAPAVYAQPTEPPALPWSLRDHYTLAVDPITLDYAVDNGQWRLSLKDFGVVLDAVSASITLGNDKTIDLPALSNGKASREPVETVLGEGVAFGVTLNTKDKLVLTHTMTSHKEHPFALFQVEVRNEGDQPRVITKISTAVFAPKTYHPPSTNCVIKLHALDPDGAPQLAVWHDPDHDAAFGVGVLPMPRPNAAVKLDLQKETWQGEIATVFDPPIQLAPGATLKSDPVWLAHTLRDPGDIVMFYQWSRDKLPKYHPPSDET